ncbi:MAG: ADP-ribosylglycohydrolase family protein [Bacteroidales bacterium]|nr:ADP-ribosylglycohydrolase family protein [Bacteroidales bacterium]
MYGAILGDLCGSLYESENLKSDTPEKISLLNKKAFYTDDSVLSCAIAEAILESEDYTSSLKKWARKYPKAGYGYRFAKWAVSSDDVSAYRSCGNGSAMRVSPLGWAFDTLEKTLEEAENSAIGTHHHREGIKGARAVAAAIFLARTGAGKEEIKKYIQKKFHYRLNKSIGEIRKNYRFEATCQRTVPQAITAFLESSDSVSTIQLALSLGGDSDTLACIAGSIAEAYYKDIPDDLIEYAESIIPEEMKTIIDRFHDKYGSGKLKISFCV